MITTTMTRDQFNALTQQELLAKGTHYERIDLTDEVGCLWASITPRLQGREMYWTVRWANERPEVLSIEEAITRGEIV